MSFWNDWNISYRVIVVPVQVAPGQKESDTTMRNRPKSKTSSLTRGYVIIKYFKFKIIKVQSVGRLSDVQEMY